VQDLVLERGVGPLQPKRKGDLNAAAPPGPAITAASAAASLALRGIERQTGLRRVERRATGKMLTGEAAGGYAVRAASPVSSPGPAGSAGLANIPPPHAAAPGHPEGAPSGPEHVQQRLVQLVGDRPGRNPGISPYEPPNPLIALHPAAKPWASGTVRRRASERPQSTAR